jgi:hypothetical protein
MSSGSRGYETYGVDEFQADVQKIIDTPSQPIHVDEEFVMVGRNSENVTQTFPKTID